jgi:uncharacterized membrane protein YhaH (DUF805 family)
MLLVFVITLLLAFIDEAIGTHIAETYAITDNRSTSTTTIEIRGLLTGMFGLAVIIPAILVDIKRWHDRDKSGWWMLIALIDHRLDLVPDRAWFSEGHRWSEQVRSTSPRPKGLTIRYSRALFLFATTSTRA